MLEKAGPWLSLLARVRPLVVAVGVASSVVACARQTYQLPAEAPPVVAADRPDGGPPPPEPSSRRGIILPGDPASGTTRLGPESGDIDTHTGTTGTRLTPGGGDGK